MSNTFIDIQKRMKDRLETDASKIEGSFHADNIQSVANELARIYSQDIETLLPKAFVKSSFGEWLDLCCSDYGVERNPATYAEAYITITGGPGIYKDVQVCADDVVFKLPSSFTIPETGTITMKGVCTQSGSIGNVLAGSINKIIGNVYHFDEINNDKAAEGGFDAESDDSLRSRTLDKIRTPSTSGNIADYKKWALEISGVEKVKIFPLARGNGTVDVILIADNNSVAPQTLIREVANYIEGCRPIGADVLVQSAVSYSILIEASVILKSDSIETVTNEFYYLLDEYLRDIAFELQTVSYMKIVELLFKTPGIHDVESYTLNGGNKSLQLATNAFPVAQPPVITLGGVTNA